MRASDIAEAQALLEQRRAYRALMQATDIVGSVEIRWHGGVDTSLLMRECDHFRLAAATSVKDELTATVRTALREKIRAIRTRLVELGVQDDDDLVRETGTTP